MNQMEVRPLESNSAPQLPLIPDKKLTWQERLNLLLKKIQRQETEIELMPFWKGIGTPLAIVSGVVCFLLTFVYPILQLRNIAPTVPFYFNSAQGNWEQGVDSSVVIFLGLGYGILLAIILRLVFEIYKYDHRLSNMISWCLFVINVLIIFTVGQLLLLARA